MTIEENISIVLRLLGRPRGERRRRVLELMELVELDPVARADRLPEGLLP